VSGRGRGVSNLPAWMDQRESSQSEESVRPEKRVRLGSGSMMTAMGDASVVHQYADAEVVSSPLAFLPVVFAELIPFLSTLHSEGYQEDYGQISTELISLLASLPPPIIQAWSLKSSNLKTVVRAALGRVHGKYRNMYPSLVKYADDLGGREIERGE
jgi:hypothetical protein